MYARACGWSVIEHYFLDFRKCVDKFNKLINRRTDLETVAHFINSIVCAVDTV